MSQLTLRAGQAVFVLTLAPDSCSVELRFQPLCEVCSLPPCFISLRFGLLAVRPRRNVRLAHRVQLGAHVSQRLAGAIFVY